MQPTDLVISVIDAAPVIDGRTALQKLVYFASVKTGTEMAFVPHYYGPYSQLVASVLENAVSFDYVNESGRRTVHDRYIYGYSLTEDGKELAKAIKKRDPQSYAIATGVVRTCRRIAHNNINILSWAAKVHYLLSRKGKPISDEEVMDTSRSFGWTLKKDEIDTGVNLLSALRLARKAGP